MRKIHLTALMLVVPIACMAQRQLPGQKGLELSVGLQPGKTVSDLFWARAGMTVNRKKGNYELYAVEYRRKKQVVHETDVQIDTYTVEGGYSFYLLGDWRRTITLSLGLSAAGGYEVVNKGKKELPNGAVLLSGNRFVYGGGLSLSLETFLADRLIILLRSEVKYLMGTSIEQVRPGVGVGVRYIF